MRIKRASWRSAVSSIEIGIAALLVGLVAVALAGDSSNRQLNEKEFQKLMQTVATGWNEGNATKAANCFREDAVYMEPPDKQIYIGRAALFEFFGGAKGPEIPMQMKLHNLAFDAAKQVGMGEYTFQMHGRYHGIVVVQLRDGKISR
jgi:ketosteroid isomerase-like protein